MTLENQTGSTGDGMSALEKAKLLKEKKLQEEKDAAEQLKAKEETEKQKVLGSISEIDGKIDELDAEKKQVEESLINTRNQRKENIMGQRKAVHELKADKATEGMLADESVKQDIFSDDEGRLEDIKVEEERLENRLSEIANEVESLENQKKELHSQTPEGQKELEKQKEEERLRPIIERLSEKMPDKERVISFENKKLGLNKILTEYVNMDGSEIMKVMAEVESENDFLDAVSRLVYEKFKDQDMKGWMIPSEHRSDLVFENSQKVSEIFNEEDVKEIIRPQLELLALKNSDQEISNSLESKKDFESSSGQSKLTWNLEQLTKQKSEIIDQLQKFLDAGGKIEGVETPEDIFNDRVQVGSYGNITFPRLKEIYQSLPSEHALKEEKSRLEEEITKKEKALFKTGLNSLKEELEEINKKLIQSKVLSPIAWSTRGGDNIVLIHGREAPSLSINYVDGPDGTKVLNFNEYQNALESRLLSPEEKVLSLKEREIESKSWQNNKFIGAKIRDFQNKR